MGYMSKDHKLTVPVIKNQVVELYIEDMTEDGEGIGKFEGYPLFLSNTVVGDRVEAAVTKPGRGYGYARLLRILVPSADRVEPRCPVAGPCGGCQLQSLGYEAQLRFKEQKVSSCLKRLGGLDEPPVRPVIGMEDPWGYRNKAQYPVAAAADGRIVCAFYGARSHRIVETEGCLLGSQRQTELLATVKEWMEERGIAPYDEETGKGVVRHVLIREASPASGLAGGSQAMVCVVSNKKKLPAADALVEKLAGLGVDSVSYNINTEKTNVIMGDDTRLLSGVPYIQDRIGHNEYRISPRSFFQVNKRQTSRLYEEVLKAAGLTGNEIVWDLYCGTGTISLFLAEKAAFVHGVEVVEAAVEDAKANAALNGIANVDFTAARAEELLPRLHDEGRLKADVVVVDPPRKGCGRELIDTLLSLLPARIVYVSCNPSTMARDVKLLSEKYALLYAQPVDMFPQTVGVECCALLERTSG
jgi:23S rRNA (uracil1939-C5)-methyltransferase